MNKHEDRKSKLASIFPLGRLGWVPATGSLGQFKFSLRVGGGWSTRDNKNYSKKLGGIRVTQA